MKNLLQSITAGLMICGLFVLGSCTKEAMEIKEDTLDISQNTGYAFSKEIKVSDDKSNYIVLKLSCDEQKILDSYSEENYTLKALTNDDLQARLSSSENQKANEDTEYAEEEFDTEGEEFISISQEVIEKNINKNYVTYELTEKWSAPKEFEDRGFDWHGMDITTKNYASITNNRCCWAIYYSFKVWQGENMETVENNRKLSGGGTDGSIGQNYGVSDKAQLLVRYRKEKHFSHYYY